ncbi:hypothetical protein [Aromatoleum petrolei]|uniref:Uncharacterized protein n=1 Tax=Aromatoleum petrolei TaxID=76116 RepID=A0ABX1MGG4_9RHOO|nr:hypothetical protein [Aromatoleum petrolei]NMF86990.1 hypothetical protein [Aromatoleum petrolei]QTQ37585.1 Uncharacterized protein ToN1_34680 [Aromatoleum petrolei]
MSILDGKMVFLSAFLIGAINAANAGTVTLSGEGVTVRYEDRAAELTGAPSLIATGLMTSPASVAGVRFAAGERGTGLQALPGAASAGGVGVGRVASPQSFAEGAALNFSLGDAAQGEGGFDVLLLAGLALFALIARQRIIALSRASHSPIFQ